MNILLLMAGLAATFLLTPSFLNPDTRLSGVVFWSVGFVLLHGLHRLIDKTPRPTPRLRLQVFFQHLATACLSSSLIGLTQIGFDNTGSSQFFGLMAGLGFLALVGFFAAAMQ